MYVFPRKPSMVQVSFRHLDREQVPPFILNVGTTMQKHLPHHDSKGEEIFEKTASCAVSSLPRDLVAAGYKLVGVSYAKKPTFKGSTDMVYAVNFLFTHQAAQTSFLTEPSAELKKWFDVVWKEFEDMCTSSLRELRVFQDWIECGGNLPLCSINLSGHQPLKRPDGKPTMIYPKKDGKICGFPKPLRAERFLNFLGDKILCLPVA
jgi:hypothetical protein